MGAFWVSASVCVAALGLQPIEHIAHERVDLIEVNHYYDHRGRLVLDQIIFYEWLAEESRYRVRDWRPLKSSDQRPRRDWQHGDFVTVWRDGDVLRKVRASSVRETWTLHDPEVADRQYHPKERRKKLWKSVLVVLDEPHSTNDARSAVAQTER